MKLSIITVVYNAQDTLLDTINSILLQDYTNIEFIVIDGNSTDDTCEVIRQQQDNIAKWVSEPDNGIYHAMNKGVKMATGDVIAMLNSGDTYTHKSVLSQVMTFFKTDTNLDIVYGDLIYVKQFDLETTVRYWTSKQYYNHFFEDGYVPAHPSLFVKRSVYEEIGLYDLSYQIASDYEWMLRLFKRNQFKSQYFTAVLVKMRLGGISNDSWGNIIINNIEIYKAWKKNGYKMPLMLFPKRIIKKIRQFERNKFPKK